MKRTLLISCVVFLIDQFSKYWIVTVMDLRSLGYVEVFPPFLNFQMGWNQGINFGLFSNSADVMRWVLVAVSIVIALTVLRWASRLAGWIGPMFAGFLIGGALGNAVDRIIYGAVADFLNMSCCGWNNPFSFNLADVFIFMGAFGFALIYDRLPKKA